MKMLNTTQSSEGEDARVKAQVLRHYPDEDVDITLSPLRDSSTGKVNGIDVDFSYRLERRDCYHTGESFDCLSWETVTSSGRRDLVAVGVKYVVGVHSISSRLRGEYCLIYLDPQTANVHLESTNATLRTAVLVGPPVDFVSDFSCSMEPDHLFIAPTDSTPNLHIVASTYSSMDSSLGIWHSILQPLLDHFSLLQDRDYTLHHATTEDTIPDLVTSTILPRAKRGIAQSIILLGGDQGVVDILNALLSTYPSASSPTDEVLSEAGFKDPSGPFGYVKPTLALIPCGSKNAIAYTNYITSNRITTHATLGFRALLLGAPIPLPFFRATFSPGARLFSTTSGGSVDLRRAATQVFRGEARGEVMESQPTLYGAIITSWAHHPYLVANNQHLGAASPPCRGRVTLFDARQNIPTGSGGTYIGDRVEKKELLRREHACVIVTPCTFLDDGFMISPETAYSGPQIVAVEFGPLNTTTETWAKRGANDSSERTSKADAASDDGELAKLMQAARKHGKHVKDKRVGYYDIGGMEIKLDNEHDDERNRQFCVDGKIISVEMGGWMEVRQVDCNVEGVLDLLGMEWESSEFTPSEEIARDALTRDGDTCLAL